MRYIALIIFFIIVFSMNAQSKEAETNEGAWSGDTSVFNSGFNGQEPVTDSKFKKTVQMMKERSLSKKQKKLREKITPLSTQSDFEHLKNFTESQTVDDDLLQSQTVMIPTAAYNEEGIHIAPGYYKLSCRKLAENMYVLDLSQGTKRIISVKAQQTKQDLEQESINFCSAQIIDKTRIRLVFGSIDLNLVGYLYFD